jgi:hypothetical protein
MNGLQPATPSAGRPRPRLVRRLHRWLGIGALAVLVLLTLSGIALNHPTALYLDRIHLTSAWLLDWYGLTVPEPTVSFGAGDQYLTLVGERLYADTREVARGIETLTGGVVAAGAGFAATSERELLLFSSSALLDRADLASELGRPIEGLAAAPADGQFLIRSAGRAYRYDAPTAQLTALPHDAAAIAWSKPSSAPPQILDGIARSYRGDGVTLERVLYDLHSGRVLGRAGVFLVDFAGIAIAVLAVTGLVLWIKGRSAAPK